MRRAAKRDSNERAIISTWEAMGAYVESVSGPGLADTLVHHKGRLFRAEVKNAHGKLTRKQMESFTKAWRASVVTYIIRTPEDATTLLNDTARRVALEWHPEHGIIASMPRAFRPGTDKARTIAEMCATHGCVTSRVPGMQQCAVHSAEVFAPGPPMCRRCSCQIRAMDAGMCNTCLEDQRIMRRP